MDSQQVPPKTAISYAHGSYDREVLALSNALREMGVDCEVDQYEDSPPEGWLRWMERMMGERTVLAVCTATYAERLRGDAVAGSGRGAAWEGRLLKGRVYDGQGRNEGVVPIIFAPEDQQHIPPFLQDVTYYDLSRPDGFERLYRRLTRQPAHPRPSLGPIQRLSADEPPAQRPPTAYALFRPDDVTFWAPLLEVERAGDNLRLKVAPTLPETAGYLRGLGFGTEIAVAYQHSAAFARVQSVRETLRDGRETFEMEFREQRFDDSYGTEMAYNGVSADDIAAMRARRILLDEGHEAAASGGWKARDFESFIRGISIAKRLPVTRSPIPLVANAVSSTSAEFLPVARLYCVMLLVLSGTVERIMRLDLSLEAGGVRVVFEGIRHKVYTNIAAPRINVDGICPLPNVVAG